MKTTFQVIVVAFLLVTLAIDSSAQEAKAPAAADAPAENQNPAAPAPVAVPAPVAAPAPAEAAPVQDVKPADAVPKPADVTPEQAARILAEALQAAPRDKQPNDQLRFNFSGASWAEVLEWFADQGELSLHYDQAPTGSVNFRDSTRTYTISEGLDLLNRLLLDRGYALVRRGRLLMMVDLEVENASKLVSELAELVSPEDLASRGRSDIVSCVFALGSMTPDEAKNQLPEMIGPWGRLIVLDSARQAKITETVDKLTAIKRVLEASKTEVVEIILKYRGADEVLETARPLLDLEPGENTAEDIRISVSILRDRMFVTGLPEKVGILQGLVEKIDMPIEVGDASDAADAVAPTFDSHKVASADIATVFDVLQTMLQDEPDTNIAIEPSGKSIIARARPAIHDRIRQTIAQMDGQGRTLKVLTLRRLDPSQALLTINKYFGITEEGGDGPIVDGDPLTGKLWIRGTPEEIAETEKLVLELEGEDALDDLGGKVRLLPYTGRAAEEALEQVEALWPVVGVPNKIHTITPSRRSGNTNSGLQERKIRREESAPKDESPAEASNAKQPEQHLVAQRDPEPAEPVMVARDKNDIVVQMTPAGILIASDDTEALDKFQMLLERFAPPSSLQSDLPTIFWLKYVKADVTAELIAAILGGGESTMSSMTDSLVGGLGGGMLGGLMGLAGGGGGGGGTGSQSKSILTATGSVNIVADARLNALFIQANGVDMQVIDMILEKVDVPESPEDIEIAPKPLLIPVIYQDAEEVAKVVKEAFGDRILGAQTSGGGNRGGQQQPSPQEFIAALRGGGRGGRGGGDTPQSQPTKINISVDARSNSLIVIAAPQDFEEVRQLVIELDELGKQVEDTISVVALPGNMNAEAVVESLEALLGTKVQVGSDSSGSNNTAGRPGGTTAQPGGGLSDEARAAIRARFFGGGGPGGGFGRGGGGPGGGGPGGGGRPGGGGGPGGGGRGR